MSDQVKKNFFCNVCKTHHDIILSTDLIKDREKFPFAYVFLHKIKNSENVEEIGLDVLTTLYIDANLSIRSVEVKKLVSSDIMSKDDSKNIITELVEEIARLQDDYRVLEEKYNNLLKDYNKLKES
ncbi:MAG: hypothetical protein ACTSVI_03550 [Promethearchaeota archaeon]